MGDHIQYDFLYDNQFAELKESEMIQSRLTNLATIEPYIGKFYSTEYVRKKVLRQTDQEIIEIDAQIEDEIMKGIIANPAAVDPVPDNHYLKDKIWVMFLLTKILIIMQKGILKQTEKQQRYK